MSTLAYLGRGWAFPVDPGTDGQLDYAFGPDKVRQSIRIILDTEPGERIMRPDFGCGLRQFLMQPNTVATRAQIQSQVQTALTNWEPRISLTSVDVVPGDDPALVQIAIAYVHVRDGRPDNLVYPFYLE
ncbi:MAG TPA: GPW/gp25 family protein [Gaiellaceae bacterium]|nr:GPW/gp25 family protein [Gaiellaceae bacterium]